MSAPHIESFSTLRKELMSLIHGCNSRDCSGLMIEDFLRHRGRNPEPSHPGNAGPAQIMKPPSSNARDLIQSAFSLTELLKGLGPEHRENERPLLICSPEHSDCLFG